MELDSTEAIKSAVETGLGVGFVSRWAIAQDLRLGSAFKIVEIEGLRMRRNFSLTCTKGPVTNELAQEFRKFLFARAGAKRASVQPRRTEPSLTDKKP
jgi:DNA-binding transcriptional LysR family regulator